jgi:hypothetical protein
MTLFAPNFRQLVQKNGGKYLQITLAHKNVGELLTSIDENRNFETGN